MNYRITTILLALALLLVIGVPAIQAAPLDKPAASVNPVTAAGNYNFTNHGTAWVPEVRGQFAAFTPKGWGMLTKAKLAGQKWVHIPIPYPSVMAGSLMKIQYVEFCAQSSNGASTKPVSMALHEYPGVFLQTNISWWADNAKHCWGYTFTTPTWRQDLGISLLLTFANTTDTITLYKAWINVVP